MNETEHKEEIELRLVTIAAQLDLITYELEDPHYTDSNKTALTVIGALYGVRELVGSCQQGLSKLAV